MAAQLSTYTDDFSSPGRGKPTRPRPFSANRRNNPHPRPDFLLPRKPEKIQSASSFIFQAAGGGNNGRSLFPPVRQLSFQHNPDGKLAHSLSARDKQLPCMPTISSSRTTHVLPSAGWQHKVHSTDPSMPLPIQKQSNMNCSKFLQPMAEGSLSNIQCCGDLHPRSKLGVRKKYFSNHMMGLQNCNLPAVRHVLTEAPKRRSFSNTTLNSCGESSCFTVVKPYKAGHYTIHPEFVSECSR